MELVFADRLECMTIVPDFGFAGASRPTECEHVKSHPHLPHAPLLKVSKDGIRQPLLLYPIDRGRQLVERLALARPDLHYDQRLTVEGQQVDLAEAVVH